MSLWAGPITGLSWTVSPTPLSIKQLTLQSKYNNPKEVLTEQIFGQDEKSNIKTQVYIPLKLRDFVPVFPLQLSG